MTNNLFIVGAGRNGTSMVAGLFQDAVAHMGGTLHPPTQENPRGYFEAAAVNQLNNQILAPYNPERQVIEGQPYLSDSPGAGKGWLSRIPLDQDVTCTDQQSDQIAQILERRPFCIKDTRFCYVLHLWRQHAPDSKMVCVFRRPEVSAASVLKSCRTRPGLFDMALSVNQALDLWRLMYLHVLERQAQHGDWLFVDYADVLSGRVLGAMRRFSGLDVDENFPTADLNRTRPEFDATPATEDIYARLKEKAETDLRRFSDV